MAGPLVGVKVLDLSRILAGPWATQVLADYGAEVIKVERPGSGDDTRQWGPPFVKRGDGDDCEDGDDCQDAAYFVAANRGKRSITIDFARPEGQQLVHSLVKDADILVENYKVGGLSKYGLDYRTLSDINPQLIYCSITGFGQTGPYANHSGYDAAIQAMSGLMSITGEPDDAAGGKPQKVGVAVTDLLTGMYAVSAITSALYRREKTGKGQQIDLALLDTQVACLANQNMNYLIGGETPQRLGSAHPNIAPYQSVKSKNSYFMLAVGNQSQFEQLCEAIGRKELLDDKRFENNQQRVKHRTELIEQLELDLVKQDSEYWLLKLAKRNVPCAPINTIPQVFEDPQIKHRNMLFELSGQNGDSVKQVANPVNFSESTIDYHLAPPKLGADNEKVLSELGLSVAKISELKESGII
jgi:crotonobetainyl-CoA:carnitine CoA-transferase CaiB-like acyl-CoA transferase